MNIYLFLFEINIAKLKVNLNNKFTENKKTTTK